MLKDNVTSIRQERNWESLGSRSNGSEINFAGKRFRGIINENWTNIHSD